MRKRLTTALAMLLACAQALCAQTISHDAMGRVTRVSYGGNTNVAYGYDEAGNITNIAFSGTISEPDTNGNGMPDMWEWIYFNNLTNTAAGDFNQDTKNNLQHFLDQTDPTDPDSDGDHSSNRDELAAGTDPTNAASVFQVSGLRFQVSNPVISWSSITNKHYRVQRSGGLTTTNFSNLRTNILAIPPLNVHTDETATGMGPWLYRIELE